MITIYHNPGCKKSREGLKYLQEKTAEIEIKNYIKEGISEQELKDVLMKLTGLFWDILKIAEIRKKSLKS